jgi:hypothetical protein
LIDGGSVLGVVNVAVVMASSWPSTGSQAWMLKCSDCFLVVIAFLFLIYF